jgi:acetylornithine/succinyldiaminopimelate/putrescine aminotransferase
MTHLLQTIAASSVLPVRVVRGEGARLFDEAGRAYWDFYGGHAVALLGQGHPRFVRALAEQARTLTFVSALAPLRIREEAADRLAAFAGMDRVFFVNSGAEANEGALKVARKATDRTAIVAMQNGFHGRTIGCLGVTWGAYRDQHQPVHGDTRFVPFGDVAALEDAVDGDVAAVIVEPVQGIAGVYEAPTGYLTAARAICSRHGAKLILDEIQTGIGRLGVPMAFHREPECAPDLVTVGKSLGCGFPVAALLLTEAMAATTRPGEHGTTFGGGPLACAVALAVLDALEEDGLLSAARGVGEQVRALSIPAVRDVRGSGCLLGLALDRPARAVVDALAAAGVLAGTANDPQCLRLCPPAVMPREGVAALGAALNQILAQPS